MSEWSDDNEVPVAPPPSTEASSRNTCAEVRSKRGEEVLEQAAKGVPQRQVEERPMMEATKPPPQAMQVDPRAVPRAQVGIAGSKKFTGKLIRKYP